MHSSSPVMITVYSFGCYICAFLKLNSSACPPKGPPRSRKKVPERQFVLICRFKMCTLGSVKRRSRLPPKRKMALTNHAPAEVAFIFPRTAKRSAPDAHAASQLQSVGKVIKWQRRRSDTPGHPTESNYAVKPLKMSHISLFIFCWGSVVKELSLSESGSTEAQFRQEQNEMQRKRSFCFCLYCFSLSS